MTYCHTLIIGAGIAGLSCATSLQSLGHNVLVVEKSRGVAGRMSTRRGDDWQCDHGAQYFTARDPVFAAEVGRWMQAGVAALWSPRISVFGDADPARRQWVEHSALAEAGLVSGGGMTREAALGKLFGLLGAGLPAAEVERLFAFDLCGELAE